MQNNRQNNSCQNGKINSFTQVNQMQKQPNKFRFGGEDVRVVNSMIDIIYPPVPFPSNKIYKALGEVKIREMVDHHHQLLLNTKVGKLFPANEEALKMAIDKSADFFVEALGGDDVFTSAHGEPHLRMRHFKIPIDESDREIWLAMYKKTLKEISFPEEHLEEFWNWIEPLSIRMINRRTNMDEIKRHHWHEIKSGFVSA
ncbi:globin [Sulfurimonas sp.]|uniref:globin domain-containing protein n=1 Tax=Sulfurimonas sp. TaxID=2022749 RepID=UPI003566C03B